MRDTRSNELLIFTVLAGIGVARGVDRDLGALSATYVLLLAVGGSPASNA